MSKLTRDQVIRLAALSKLHLTESEIKKFQAELSRILDYVDMLDNVDVSGLEPTYQVTGLENVMRDDEVVIQQASPDELLKLLPDKKDRFIKVKRMI
ncbi:Asp-tRNA(Asn)/Glu-tRNA(Gln) amidotransferase subunit GatC [Candidatus Saccharibacteria bacterium]|nr:Asp-tRNA(Asn)/Glu-tRNA(Gln) amidotransferase subunit GatC [Candidatus Saccharibacteria bacterium]